MLEHSVAANAPTPVQTLTEMLSTAEARNSALDEDAPTWSSSSRIWSRQIEALICAIIAEPPQTIDDALSVLCALAEYRDAVDMDDTTEKMREVRNRDEMTDVAVHNCIVAIARDHRPRADLAPVLIKSVDWSARLAKNWLPDGKARFVDAENSDD